MAHHDLESLLTPLADEAPSGPDLEYDADFQTLERTATPKAERAIGDSVKTAEEPDWDKVSSLGEALLGRSRDLRVAVHLTSAWTRMHGLAGWSDGLALIRGLLENLWDSVHPQLDAEDDNDPTARVNAVMPLVDMQGVLGYFRGAPFVQSPRLGRFSLRDLRIANGTLKTSAEGDAASPSMTDIEACCLDCPEEQLLDAAQATTTAMEHARHRCDLHRPHRHGGTGSQAAARRDLRAQEIPRRRGRQARAGRRRGRPGRRGRRRARRGARKRGEWPHRNGAGRHPSAGRDLRVLHAARTLQSDPAPAAPRAAAGRHELRRPDEGTGARRPVGIPGHLRFQRRGMSPGSFSRCPGTGSPRHARTGCGWSGSS